MLWPQSRNPSPAEFDGDRVGNRNSSTFELQ
jgi:hypothetical protein